jgi:hypothetical protein
VRLEQQLDMSIDMAGQSTGIVGSVDNRRIVVVEAVGDKPVGDEAIRIATIAIEANHTATTMDSRHMVDSAKDAIVGYKQDSQVGVVTQEVVGDKTTTVDEQMDSR